MKKILYTILAAFILVSCGGNGNNGNNGEVPGPGPEPIVPAEPTLQEKICGEWHTSNNQATADIYVSFTKDGAFELYQKIGDGAYRLYRGKWGVEDNVISGKYNDGNDWACSYEVEMGSESMTWTSQNDFAEKNVYNKAEIPASVKDNCVVEVKSPSENILFL